MKICYNNPPAVVVGVFRESEVIMSVLERVVQFLYEILQRWSGWWYASGGQQETRLLQLHSTVLTRSTCYSAAGEGELEI